jgi:translation initiation factor 5A
MADSQTTDIGTNDNRLRPGSLVVYKDSICRVVEIASTQDGKDGYCNFIAKVRCLETYQAFELSLSTDEMIDAPIVNKTEYQVLNLDEDVLELMDPSGEVRYLVFHTVIAQLRNEIDRIFNEGKKECLVLVINVMGIEQVESVKEGVELYS